MHVACSSKIQTEALGFDRIHQFLKFLASKKDNALHVTSILWGLLFCYEL